MITRLLMPFALVSLILVGALFGFFYAWVCSTMWGLDAADPRVAIAAMQAMNASVRNAVFAPVFFGTPFALLITGATAWGAAERRAAYLFLAAGVVTLFGCLVLTMSVNVPMNLALGELTVPTDMDQAAAIWADYSPRWQIYNQTRTVLAGLGLALTGLALLRITAPRPPRG